MRSAFVALGINLDDLLNLDTTPLTGQSRLIPLVCFRLECFMYCWYNTILSDKMVIAQNASIVSTPCSRNTSIDLVRSQEYLLNKLQRLSTHQHA